MNAVNPETNLTCLAFRVLMHPMSHWQQRRRRHGQYHLQNPTVEVQTAADQHFARRMYHSRLFGFPLTTDNTRLRPVPTAMVA